MERRIKRESKASFYFKKSIETETVKFNSVQKDLGETKIEAMSAMAGAQMPPRF